MATKKAQGVWNDLPPWGRGAVVIAGLYAGYKLIDFFFSDSSGGTTSHLPPGTNLTYLDYQYKVFADQLESAWLDGLFGATENDQAMANILMMMNTDDDVIALNNAWDERHVHGMSWLSGGNLNQVIQADLDNSEKREVNENYASKGMTWRWL